MKTNRFEKIMQKLNRFENNRAKVDFLLCKNGHRDPAASGGDPRRSDMIIQAVEPPAGICGRDP